MGFLSDLSSALTYIGINTLSFKMLAKQHTDKCKAVNWEEEVGEEETIRCEVKVGVGGVRG